jgi:tyrosinase
MEVPTRKAAWSATTPADGWTEEIRWYAAAVHQMKLLTPGLAEFRPLALHADQLLGIRPRTAAIVQEVTAIRAELRPIISAWSDPMSLGYQSQVHATHLVDPTAWPQHLGETALWHECAHGNWFFLPWHRAYLLEFEAVARAHLKALGGPHVTWALPYWNSSDYLTLSDAATLPLPLRDATLPDTVDVPGVTTDPGGQRPNPLHEPSRRGPRPLTGPPSFASWPDASMALNRAHYANAEGSNLVSFAGGFLEDFTFFHFANEGGMVDQQPHGSGHVAVGGLMASFSTAGLDPVFWMHHANADRLWETYANDLGHGYPFPDGRPAGPDDSISVQAFESWTGREFPFLRPDGVVKSWTAPQVLDVEERGYRYDTIEAPQFTPIPAPPAGAGIQPFGLADGDSTPIAAASDVEVAQTRSVTLTGGAGEGGADLVDPGSRWTLHFDGIRCQRPALTSYAVYLDLDDAEEDPDRLLGLLSLFGVFESSLEENGDLGGSRLIEATSVVHNLPGFDPLSARLTLVPSRPDEDLESMGLTIERISLDVG